MVVINMQNKEIKIYEIVPRDTNLPTLIVYADDSIKAQESIPLEIPQIKEGEKIQYLNNDPKYMKYSQDADCKLIPKEKYEIVFHSPDMERVHIKFLSNIYYLSKGRTEIKNK